MRLLVVIVNYRTAGLVIDCLRSLDEERKLVRGLKVAVVDCHSEDDSVETLSQALAKNEWRQWVRLMALDRNAGFAGGNNAAMRAAMRAPNPPEYVMLLNPDTVVKPGAVRALLDFMNTRAEAGLAGSRLEDGAGEVQVSAFRFPSLLSEVESALRFGVASRVLARWQVAPMPSNKPAPADWLSGASLMIRSVVIEQIGFLDEGYFMYYEDADFCRAASDAGWACWYVPASRVVHLVSRASDIENAEKPRPAYWFESRRRYFIKNHGALYARLCDAAWIAAFSLWRARRCVMRKPDTDPPHLLRDFIRASVFAKGTAIQEACPDCAVAGEIEEDDLPANVVPFDPYGRKL